MAVLLNIEKAKSFAVPREELFKICEAAVGALGLTISRMETESGTIEALKPARWPFRSKERISLTITPDSRIVAIAKVDMGKAVSSGDVIVHRFFDEVKRLVEARGR